LKNSSDKSRSYFWSLFHDIVRDAKGNIEKRSDRKLKKDIKIARTSFSPMGRGLKKLSIANIYAHIYIPKYKDDPQKLPFYDEFPLYIPITFDKGRIFAFNLHYLKPANRKIFIKNYIKYLKNRVRTYYSLNTKHEVNLDEVDQKLLQRWGETYMNQFLGSHKNSVLKVCVRSYLPNHIASRIFKLNMGELDKYQELNMTFAPVFKRKTAKEIYAEVERNYIKYADSDWSFK
jgi:hypothetical protein